MQLNTSTLKKVSVKYMYQLTLQPAHLIIMDNPVYMFQDQLLYTYLLYLLY